MASLGTVREHSRVPLMFREDGHVLIALDAEGDLIPVQGGEPRGQLIDVAISCDRISIGNAVIDKTIATMLKACRDYDDNTPAPLPPAASARTSDGRTLLVDIFLVPRALGKAINRARFMLVLREVRGRPRSRKSHMRQSFGLTVTEADLADLLAQGMSLTEVSERLCISIWTARSHLRAIFQKTGTHRQAELVALLNHTGP